jgi:F0F1-type ATP synthase assembly protein I
MAEGKLPIRTKDRVFAAVLWLLIGLFVGLALGFFVGALPVFAIIGLVCGALAARSADRRAMADREQG